VRHPRPRPPHRGAELSRNKQASSSKRRIPSRTCTKSAAAVAATKGIAATFGDEQQQDGGLLQRIDGDTAQ
jgi:hypothetical protein